MARRGRVFGATQCKVNQWTNNQMKQGCGWWSDLLCSLRVVAQWGKEGGDGPTVLVVLCTGQAVDFGGTLADHFSRLATSVTVFSPCLKATATCCVVLCCCMVCCGVMSQDAGRKRKKGTLHSHLKSLMTATMTRGYREDGLDVELCCRCRRTGGCRALRELPLSSNPAVCVRMP